MRSRRLLTRRPSAAVVTGVLAMAGTAYAAPADLALTTDAKRAVMSFLAGTYGSECAMGRGKDMPMPRPGTSIVFAAEGTISWAGLAFDVTRLHVNEMGVTRLHGAFASKIDIDDPGKGQRIAVAGVAQPAGQPAGATITVGDDPATAPFGLCQGGPPSGASTSLWPMAARLLGTASRTASCMDLKSNVQSHPQVSFDGRQLVIGPHKYAPVASANEESLSVDDGNGDIAYTFGAADEMVIVSRPAGGKGRHFQVTPVADPMSIFACDTE